MQMINKLEVSEHGEADKRLIRGIHVCAIFVCDNKFIVVNTPNISLDEIQVFFVS